jgi:glycosyltransferase involved in cell wall biosynthesis
MSLEVSTQKKRILIVGPVPPPYHGVAVMIKSLIDGLKRREGFQFIHFNTQDFKKSKDFGRLTARNGWLAARFILRLLTYLVRERIDLVYVPISQNFWGFARDSIFILISGLLFKRKVIIHLHGGHFKRFFDRSTPPGKLYKRFVFRYVDRGIVLGHCLKGVLRDVLPPDRIDVVYNGVDTASIDDVKPDPRNKENFRVLFAGVLAESKGYFDLIKAIPSVTARHPDVQVLIAGRWENDSLKNRVSAFIRENKLEDKVRFVGVVTGEEKAKLFKGADLFVYPTYFHLGEGQPVAILEAMASGLPVIATDRGSIKEMIIDGQNGFIVPASSPHQIAEKISLLIANETLREEMGTRNRSLAREKFSLSQYLEGVATSAEKAVCQK